MRAWNLAPLILLLALAGPAIAGSEAQPEVTDAAQDAGAAGAWGDIVAGWFGATARDVTFTMRLSQLTLPESPYAWYVRAAIDAQEYAWWAYTDGVNTTFYHAHWSGTEGPSDYEPGTGVLSAGSPGMVRIDLPRTFAANVTDGATLRVAEVGTGSLREHSHPVPFGNFTQDDTASGGAYVVRTEQPAPPTPTPPTGGPDGNAIREPGEEGDAVLTPGPGVGALALVAAALALVRGRRSREP